MSNTDKADAYRKAVYYVYPTAEEAIAFHVGELSAELGMLLDRQGATQGVFVSAYNPHSTDQPSAKNAEAHQRLCTYLIETDRSWCKAGGGHPAAGETEPAVFVLGMDRQEGLKLARDFGQDALVFVTRRAAPELVWA